MLSGNRNQCTGCNEYFNHGYGFDRHRTGKHTGNQRRCLSVAEIVKKGFQQERPGFWSSEPQTTTTARVTQGHSRKRPAEGQGDT